MMIFLKLMIFGFSMHFQGREFSDNLEQNICRLFHVLAQLLFTTSERELDFYHQLSVRVVLQDAEKRKATFCRWLVFRMRFDFSTFFSILSEIFSEFLIFCNWFYEHLGEWNNKKIQERGRYLPILHEATCDNYFIVKYLLKPNTARDILFTC